MELNFMIFPAPRLSYREEHLRELVKIPYYDDLFKFQQTSPKTRIQFHKMDPFKPPEEVPNDVSQLSIYDDQVDELPSQRIPHMNKTISVSRQQNMFTVQENRNNMRVSTTPRVSSSSNTFNQFNNNRNYRCSKQIPCLYLKASIPTKKTILYFHANCEDLLSSYNLVDFIRHNMKMNVLSVEYPGYGLYQGYTNEENILKDAEYIYKYVAFHSVVEEKNMIVMGRSIGTGVACHLASIFQPGLLVLISPFLSLQEIVNEKYPLVKKMVKERFVNKDKIQQAKCPVFILHGLKDNIVSVEQGKKLFDLCKSACLLRTPPEMTHTRFQFENDLTLPLLNFMRSLNLL
ncbi:unnamed protein product (macronuclear) [Paramecium tetraurelia]|uniref:Serine aminopeptidase S33 domain-containing protein n=1 Tax=Paramecium tetraurelia TaxID=5888 RepID=A0D321_PARTE|nr:uncharacterized protein GSPATT00012923001 [Paramecium tetraurelia]CAK77438.1 unnamed protein product [Paramecium tetraurelia]|eukprot:XP_001444835.1 hypothetical protein (macronuclear) [Paramecium tetraurelia strain d4-2]